MNILQGQCCEDFLASAKVGLRLQAETGLAEGAKVSRRFLKEYGPKARAASTVRPRGLQASRMARQCRSLKNLVTPAARRRKNAQQSCFSGIFWFPVVLRERKQLKNIIEKRSAPQPPPSVQDCAGAACKSIMRTSARFVLIYLPPRMCSTSAAAGHSFDNLHDID